MGRMQDVQWIDKVKAGIDESDQYTMRRLDSIKSSETGIPLNVPTKYNSNQLGDSLFLMYAKRRLLYDFNQESHCAHCGGTMDKLGEHAFRCKKIGKVPQHNEVRDAIYGVCAGLVKRTKKNNHVVRKETCIKQYRRDGKGSVKDVEKTRADVEIKQTMPYHKSTLIDVTLRYIKPGRSQGRAAAKGEEEKLGNYHKLYKFPHNVEFVPFGMDTFGDWGPAARDWIQKVCRAFSEDQDPKVMSEMYNRAITNARIAITMALVRGTTGRIRKMLEGEEVYYDRTEVVDVDGQLWEGDFRNI